MGELAALTAAGAWAFASVLWARLGASYDEVALNFLKCALATAMLMAALVVLQGRAWPAGVTTTELFWLGLSGLAGLTLGDSALFFALTRIGARRSLLIWALSPGAAAALAWPVLGEPIDGAMAVGMALTLAGVVWVVRERATDEDDVGGTATVTAAEGAAAAVPSAAAGEAARRRAGYLFAAVAMVGQGTSNVMVKLGGESAGALGASTVRLAIGAAGLGLWLGAVGRLGRAIPPLATPGGRGLVLLATLTGTTAGIWLSTYGLLHADVGVASTLNSTSPILVLPLAALMQGERVSARAILGAGVAVAGVAVFFLT